MAIGQFGKPHALRTDNAPQLVSKRFRGFLRLLNIRHQRSDVGCPWQNGFIERLFGTLKQKLNQINVDNGAQLNFALHEFNTWYNEIRPHQGLDGRTPAEAWAWLTECISAKQFEEKVIESVAPFVAWEGLLTGYRIRWRSLQIGLLQTCNAGISCCCASKGCGVVGQNLGCFTVRYDKTTACSCNAT